MFESCRAHHKHQIINCVTYLQHKKNVLSVKQVTQFKDILNSFVKSKKPSDHLLPNLQYGLDYKHVREQLHHIVFDLIGPHDVPGCFLQRSIKPHAIHSDYGTSPNGKEPYFAILFPLYCDGPAHTIVFAESSKESIPGEKDPVTGYSFDQSQQKMLSHVQEYSLDRVGQPQTVLWCPGDAIVWKRENFHCSDNFPLNGTTVKDSLVLFTTKQPDHTRHNNQIHYHGQK